MAAPETRAPLRTGALVAYGLMTLPLAIAGLPLAIFIPPFYTQELGLNLTTVGIVLMVARISDVLTDPVIGALSDRLPTPWGRRRPWIVVGTPVMMLGTWMLFVPGPGVGAGYLLLWIAILYLGWTLVGIPYAAWGAELSTDYHERSRVTAAREIFTVIGLILAGAIPPAMGVGAGATLGDGMRALAVVTVILLPIGALLVAWLVPETGRMQAGAPPARNALRAVWRNGPFRRLLAGTVLGNLAGAINQSLAVLFYAHVLRLPSQASLLILVYFVAGVVAVPFWVAVSRRFTKHRTLAVAVLWGCAWFLVTPWLPPDRILPAALVTLMTGSVMAVAPVLGGSMAADVIDLDALRSRSQRSGLFFALWAMGAKLALALGVGIALPILDWFGFQPNAANGPQQISALVGLYCIVPVVLWVLSIVPLWNFPMTPERQRRMQASLVRREARRAA